ncbi:Peroxiredoxin [Chitinophaga sp. YR573]|uniref:TlpA disulfide reductase family protein n=1 Tax=Chitinophaga sp. YR573 TaxID=1881040 RepID=UPI0008C6F019|nr:TlpA disulfide reductase family protein [Chitinophaga sp. YR573]SEW17351.1 Peroxiredoxin [Chitinophaga sp. YR573]
MRKLIFTALAIAPLLGQAQSIDYQLTVKLPTLKMPSKAYLVYGYGWSNQRVIDSAELIKGTFSFKGTAEDNMKAMLVIDHSIQGLQNLDRMADTHVVYLTDDNILIKGKDSVKYAVVTGSALNTEYTKYSKTFAVVEKALGAIDAEYIAAPDAKKNDTAFFASLKEKVNKANQLSDSLKYVYIRQNPDSYFSLEVLTELAGEDIDIYKIQPLFKGLSARLRNTKAGTDFAKLLYNIGATSIGAMAPNFTQNDVNDKPVKLSDFRGKYVLLDFWASWCGPCRAENPNVVKAFNKYKDKNFTVLGVSLDQPGKKEAWLAAIKADGLPWTQVSDLQFWNNAAAKQYDIRAIPQNFLIDPTGKIVAKNLRGEALEKKLEELLIL